MNKLKHQHFNIELNKFSHIRTLIDQQESYLKVYGLSQLIDLIESKDIEALSNKQTIIGIATNALNDNESYVYLKAVKVILLLLTIDSSLIYTLCEEFLNNNETLNYRLKIGEVMVKVLESSKTECHEFKANLINCFLNGCKDKQEEIICSSYVNMATICKFYRFDVKNFYYEIILMIEATTESPNFLLAKRSSTFFLKELVCGIQDSLQEFEDYIPNLYKLLNQISQTTNDPVTRTHANNGLKLLSNQCLKFMFPEQKLIKKINI